MPLKLFLYRKIFGFHIDRGARIGISLLDARMMKIGKGARIGHFNIILDVGEIVMEEKAEIGFCNFIRGGRKVFLGSFSKIWRFNIINAIPEPDCITNPSSEFFLGEGSVIVSEHRIDFTDRVEIGRNVVVGGRNSSFWTHSRQISKPIKIGDFCYLGSDVRVAPGVVVAPCCIVALGSVLMGKFEEPLTLIGGNPARVLRHLKSPVDLYLIAHPTRRDIPEERLRLWMPGLLIKAIEEVGGVSPDKVRAHLGVSKGCVE